MDLEELLQPDPSLTPPPPPPYSRLNMLNDEADHHKKLYLPNPDMRRSIPDGSHDGCPNSIRSVAYLCIPYPLDE